MKIDNSGLHLGYCTNIHPGDGWNEVFNNIKKYTISIKNKIYPHYPFGIGLRISNSESEELLKENNLNILKEYCKEHNIYIFTINGFPFGAFHRKKIK